MSYSNTKTPISRASTLDAFTTLINTLDAAAAPHELTSPQLRLLFALGAHSGPLEQVELYKYTQVGRTANSRNVAKLGAGVRPSIKRGLGWLEAFEDVDNRKKNLVRLTPLGSRVLNNALDEANRFLFREE